VLDSEVVSAADTFVVFIVPFSIYSWNS